MKPVRFLITYCYLRRSKVWEDGVCRHKSEGDGLRKMDKLRRIYSGNDIFVKDGKNRTSHAFLSSAVSHFG